MSGVQTSILNSPEQNRHAFDPPYEANDLVALAFARYPYPEFFFGWTPSSGGTVMFARTDRLPPWIGVGRENRCLSGGGRARSAGDFRHCAGGSKQTSPSAGGIRCSTRRSEGSRTKSSPSSRTREVRENASTACSAWPSISSGRATTTSTTSFTRWRRSQEMPAPPPLP